MSILIGLAHELIFNAVWSSASSFRTKPKVLCGLSLLTQACFKA
ncbi:hypothetical protein CZ787_14400 [Halomonas citrativorans]|uniref:Uncharacterized protein n=1 Tax=Halomonas citrativorans TaxID=2742612 RepID=A0A1R4I3H8_9GAMM|nr:hypothetical protein CZ787_14400 [Halomonas citrativorans]